MRIIQSIIQKITSNVTASTVVSDIINQFEKIFQNIPLMFKDIFMFEVDEQSNVTAMDKINSIRKIGIKN